MKNYKKVIAITLSSAIINSTLQGFTSYAIENKGDNEPIEEVKVDNDSVIRPIESNDLKKYSNESKLLKIAPEKPYITSISKSVISIGSSYYANIGLYGQARSGSTVYIKLGSKTAKQYVDASQMFGFSIETRSRNIIVELYTVNSRGEQSDSTFVNLTSDGDYIINNGTIPTPNTLPNIIAQDITIRVGSSFDPLKFVNVWDDEDGDLTKYVHVRENTVDTSKIGEYKVVYEVMDSDDNIAIKEIKVNVDTNKKPSIEADNITLKVGDKFNPLDYATAQDFEDGDITSKIVVKENTVDISKVGEYKVVYTVTDSEGETVTKEINVIVRSNEKPVITATNKVLKVGDIFNVKTGVSASDKEDGDLTSKIVVKENTVNTNKVGTYKVVYEVTDSDKNTVIKEIKVTVRSNDKPVINVTDQTIKIGDKFDAKSIAKVSDKEDGDLTSKIVVKENNVNANKVGTYKVVYEVTDSDKNTINKEIKVIVNNVFVNFTVNNIDNKTTVIKGKGVSGATVKAYVGTKQIGNTVTVNSSGNYSMTIPTQSANTKITVEISKSGYETAKKTISVIGVTSGAKRTQTTDIYKYDAGKGKYLTYINGRGYSQFVYLNKSGKYAFTPSSWMVAAGLDVSMPKSSNGYTMTIDNNYIQMYNEANDLLSKIKAGEVAKANIEGELDKIKDIKTKDVYVQTENTPMVKASPTKTLTKDIFKYDIGKGKHLTYINGKGYSQFVYLNKSGNYAFTPSSWMVAAGLTVTMPTSSNGYTMKIDNPYITKYNDVVKQIESYI